MTFCTGQRTRRAPNSAPSAPSAFELQTWIIWWQGTDGRMEEGVFLNNNRFGFSLVLQCPQYHMNCTLKNRPAFMRWKRYKDSFSIESYLRVGRLTSGLMHYVAPVPCCIFDIVHFGIDAPLKNAAPHPAKRPLIDVPYHFFERGCAPAALTNKILKVAQVLHFSQN